MILVKGKYNTLIARIGQNYYHAYSPNSVYYKEKLTPNALNAPNDNKQIFI